MKHTNKQAKLLAAVMNRFLAFLMLLYLSSTVAAQQYPVLRTTDRSGQEETLGCVFFETSPYLSPGHYFALRQEASTETSWVDWSQITRIDIVNVGQSGENTSLRVTMRITLQSHEILTGTPTSDTRLSGDTEFGRKDVLLSSLRRIELVGCGNSCEEIKRGQVKQPRVCSEEWLKGWHGPESTWIVEGDGVAKSRSNLQILDRFGSGYSRITRTTGSRQAFSWDKIGPVVDSTGALFSVPLADLRSVEFTGQESNGGPELVLTARSGNTRKFSWLREASGDRHFDDDDMLLWFAGWGYLGQPLTPLRHLKLTRKD